MDCEQFFFGSYWFEIGYFVKKFNGCWLLSIRPVGFMILIVPKPSRRLSVNNCRQKYSTNTKASTMSSSNNKRSSESEGLEWVETKIVPRFNSFPSNICSSTQFLTWNISGLKGYTILQFQCILTWNSCRLNLFVI